MCPKNRYGTKLGNPHGTWQCCDSDQFPFDLPVNHPIDGVQVNSQPWIYWFKFLSPTNNDFTIGHQYGTLFEPERYLGSRMRFIIGKACMWVDYILFVFLYDY